MALQHEAVLRAWPALRGYFAARSSVDQAELTACRLLLLPELREADWQAGLRALVQHGLLYPLADHHWSFVPPAPRRRFETAVEGEWQQLWQALRTRLIYPVQTLWSTQWLAEVLPAHPPVLVLEVVQVDLRTAARIAHQEFGYAPLVPGQASPPPLLHLQPVRRTTKQAAAEIRVADLEKIVVDLPQVLQWNEQETPRLMAAVLTKVRAYYQVNETRLQRVAARRGQSSLWQQPAP